MAQYKVNYYDPSGNQKINGLVFSTLSYVRKVNTIGQMSLLLPPIVDPSIFEPDGRLELYRSIGNSNYYLEGETSFLIERIRKFTTDQGEDQIEITANDMLKVLARRLVAYEAGSTYTLKIAEIADDCMKDVIRENLGVACIDTTRNITTWLQVAGNTTQGAAISAEISWKNVFDVMLELAQASLGAGVRILFDIVKTGSNLYAFRTYLNFRGVDHSRTSAMPVVLSDDFGSLSTPEVITDISDEKNYVYCGGRGEDGWRPIEEASNATSMDRSPFARSEVFYNEGNSSDPVTLQNTAKRVLENTQARVIFNGQALNTYSYLYGLHYGFGDLVTAKYKGVPYNCRVDTIKIDIGPGQDSIDIRLASGDEL